MSPRRTDQLNKWKPGESGNPKGRPPQTEDQKRLRTLTKEQMKQIGDLILTDNFSALDEVISSPKSTVLEAWIASVAKKAIAKGDMFNLNLLLDRLIGKVRDQFDPDDIMILERVKYLRSLPQREVHQLINQVSQSSPAELEKKEEKPE